MAGKIQLRSGNLSRRYQRQRTAWNHSLSTWESTDLYHVGAGKVLENQQSTAIVARLLGQYENVDNLPARDVRTVLEQRCVSCHAPSQISATDSGKAKLSDETAWQEKLIDGVSCEACHGPASNWIESHTRKDFTSISAGSEYTWNGRDQIVVGEK